MGCDCQGEGKAESTEILLDEALYAPITIQHHFLGDITCNKNR